MEVLISAVRAKDRLVLLSNDDTAEIDTFLDWEGDETEDHAEAVVAVFPYKGLWFVIDLREFENEVRLS